MSIKLNYWIDFLAFISFLITSITGIILWVVFLGGSGSGKSLLWGLPKQTWVLTHNWIGIVLLILVAIHFILHWNWIKNMTKLFFGKKKK